MPKDLLDRKKDSIFASEGDGAHKPHSVKVGPLTVEFVDDQSEGQSSSGGTGPLLNSIMKNNTTSDVVGSNRAYLQDINSTNNYFNANFNTNKEEKHCLTPLNIVQSM